MSWQDKPLPQNIAGSFGELQCKTVQGLELLLKITVSKCWQFVKVTQLDTVSQVAPSWCLHSSTCQFGNGTPKARNLPDNSQVTSAAKNLNTLLWYST